MQFEFVRLSLLERAQYDIADHIYEKLRRPTREEWLRELFSKQIQFEHRTNNFFFVPLSTPKGSRNIITGKIGRQVTSKENEPPSQKLEDTERLTWKASYVFIDPTTHEDGQKVALEFDPSVGRPIALFESLIKQINSAAEPNPYIVESAVISNSENFWNFVSKHDGEITKVQFELIAPNMFNSPDDVVQEMRDMRDNERVRRLKYEVDNSDGLNLQTERMRNAADYATKGGGSIQARTKTNRKFNSRDRAQKVTIPDKELKDHSREGLISTVIRSIFRI